MGWRKTSNDEFRETAVRVSKEIMETSRYQANLARASERAGDYTKARRWSDKSVANKRLANALQQGDED
jgi:hypothetical protein